VKIEFSEDGVYADTPAYKPHVRVKAGDVLEVSDYIGATVLELSRGRLVGDDEEIEITDAPTLGAAGLPAAEYGDKPAPPPQKTDAEVLAEEPKVITTKSMGKKKGKKR
jgi:hypothetical protein